MSDRPRNRWERSPAEDRRRLMIALAIIAVIGAGGAWVGLKVAHLGGRAAHAIAGGAVQPDAVGRLVEHHCNVARDGSERVSGQLANDGPTGTVKASAYVLIGGGEKLDAGAAWNAYDAPIERGSSEFFSATVPVPAGDRVLGCGVLIGSSYAGDGAP